MRSTTRRWAVVLLVAPLAALASPPAAVAVSATFSNLTAITIPTSGPAGAYPSPIAVSGMAGTISDVDVTIGGFTHAFPVDVGMVLVAPNGDALLIVDGVGASEHPASNVTWTVDDAAAGPIPNAGTLTSGSYKPSAYHLNRSFPAPGPLLAYGNPGPAGGPASTATLASTFNGDDPNGTWNLYVYDFQGGDGGSIDAGWSLTVTTTGGGGGGPTDTQPPATTLTGHPQKKTTKTKAKFTFSSDEPGTFQCSVDGADFTPCSSPYTKRHLAKGKHRFQVLAVDLAGNKDGSPAAWRWKVKKPR